ncbi:hypothetical protein [Aneurinibacillus danicus]|uniref:Uncharacterized protein n=1 Tax=Aneurinibacillus danicus TaxID=267746 RepID=A0A511VAP8_9BACL|nr:hypothetical protein [Aneurinibacillus danicus]GEN36006.1 hypothetical protein ADA01nite_34660 [Aneurinibacillus danicus]
MNNIKNRIILLFGALIYGALLSWVYIDLVSPYFAYMGYVYYPAFTPLLILGFTAAALPALWMPIAVERPSQVVYWILYVLVYIPASIIPFYTLTVETGKLVAFLLSMLSAFAILGASTHLPYLPIRRLELPPILFWLGIALVSAVFYALIVGTYGIRFDVAALADVYDVREKYKESGGGAVSYAIAWQAGVINPLIMAYGLVLRKPGLVATGLFGQLVIFSITGQKSIFFSLLLNVVLLILLNRKKGGFGTSILYGATIFTVLCVIVDWFLNEIAFVSLFVRRLILTPGLLTGYYFEFFSSNPKVYLAHSIFKSFIDYPYSLKPVYLIGYQYMGSASTAANANLWADSFANFGYMGIFIFTLLLSAVLWIFDSITRHSEYQIKCLILGIPAFALSNSALLTTLLTHGILLALLLAYVLPGVKKKEVRDKEETVSSLELQDTNLSLSYVTSFRK